MKVFDFNVHLPYCRKNEVDEMIVSETSLKVKDLEASYTGFLNEFKMNISDGNFMLFNQNLFSEAGASGFIGYVRKDFNHSYFTALVDFRRSNVFDYIDNAIAQGVNFIKFHSYVQMILESDFPEILRVCRYVEMKGIPICFDASFGTTKMFVYDNLKLIAFIAEFITRVPLIILHSGGVRVLEAVLLASDRKNLYLETSFSLPYLQNSSVEQDFAFAYKKIGSERVLYGSDFPYESFDKAQTVISHFFDKYRFDMSDVEKIMYKNALRLGSNE